MADKAEYTESVLREYKTNPRNKTHVGLEEGFFVNNKDLVVNIVLTVEGETLLQ